MNTLATDELQRRFDGNRRYPIDNELIIAMTKLVASESKSGLRSLVDAAFSITGADAVGVCMLDTEDGAAVFRWRAVAGDMHHPVGQVMPASGSVSREAIVKNAVLLLTNPGSHHPTLAALRPPLAEVLVAPLLHQGAPAGAAWLISRRGVKRFDIEDARFLKNLCAVAVSERVFGE